MSGVGIRRVTVLRSGLQVTDSMSPAAVRARSASAVRASVERGDWRDVEPEWMLVTVGGERSEIVDVRVAEPRSFVEHGAAA